MTKARDLSVGIPNGLVLIKPTGATNGTVNDSGTVTIGSAVSSVTVSGAFSATYDNYKIVVAGGVGSANTNVGLKLGASATGYYSGAFVILYSNATSQSVNDNNATSWTLAVVAAPSGFGTDMTLLNPFLAVRTVISSSRTEVDTAAAAGFSMGFHNVATSYTAFTLTPASGTLTGGTISIYGYRK